MVVVVEAPGGGAQPKKGARKRNEGSRSRMGCLTCRARHIRCDEQRPHCLKCLYSEKTCKYPESGQPIHDRRLRSKTALPGQQAPWLLSQAKAPTISKQFIQDLTMDPFDTLSITMPYASKELFHYFHQYGLSYRVVRAARVSDRIASATADPHALRNVVLIAGLHYSWNAGDLRAFQSAFLFHKVESLRSINSGIENATPDSLATWARQICTLSLAEACLGNIPVGEAHLNGLLAFLDVMEKRYPSQMGPRDVDRELADRYVLLTYNFIGGFKSFLKGFARGAASEQADGSLRGMGLIHAYHKYIGVPDRLKALHLLPHFFCPVSLGRRLRKVDVMPLVHCLRVITDVVNHRDVDPMAGNRNSRLWREGGPNKLLLTCVELHVQSFEEEDSPSPSSEASDDGELLSSWASIFATMGMYLHVILRLTNLDTPHDPRYVRFVFLKLKEETEQDLDDMRGHSGQTRQDLWFWRAFIQTLSLAGALRELQNRDPPWAGASPSQVGDLTSALAWMEDKIAAWGEVSGTVYWQDAKIALQRIAWPNAWYAEHLAEALWYRASTGRQSRASTASQSPE